MNLATWWRLFGWYVTNSYRWMTFGSDLDWFPWWMQRRTERNKAISEYKSLQERRGDMIRLALYQSILEQTWELVGWSQDSFTRSNSAHWVDIICSSLWLYVLQFEFSSGYHHEVCRGAGLGISKDCPQDHHSNVFSEHDCLIHFMNCDYDCDHNVYLKPDWPSSGFFNVPASTFLFMMIKYVVVHETRIRIKNCKPAVIQSPLMYRGASACLKTVEPRIPPSPPTKTYQWM